MTVAYCFGFRFLLQASKAGPGWVTVQASGKPPRSQRLSG